MGPTNYKLRKLRLTVTLPLGSTLPNPHFHALMTRNSKNCFKGLTLNFQGGFDGTIKIFLGKNFFGR